MAPFWDIDPGGKKERSHEMRVDTKRRKKARQGFEQVYGDQEFAGRMFHILQAGVGFIAHGARVPSVEIVNCGPIYAFSTDYVESVLALMLPGIQFKEIEIV